MAFAEVDYLNGGGGKYKKVELAANTSQTVNLDFDVTTIIFADKIQSGVYGASGVWSSSFNFPSPVNTSYFWVKQNDNVSSPSAYQVGSTNARITDVSDTKNPIVYSGANTNGTTFWFYGDL